MIKRLLFAAALLVPGLAYGGNPSANLSIQVVPATTGGTCGSITGQAGTDAAVAGFNTCALYNDFTTAIPNSVGTGLPAGWLNCNGRTTDTNAVWNNNSIGTVECSVQQITDPTYGNLTLDLDFKAANIQQNTGWPGNMMALETLSGVNDGVGVNPAHSFSNAYYEITYRVNPVPGTFSGGTQTFWQFLCCGGSYPFVDNEIFEDWSTWGSNIDYGDNQWLNSSTISNTNERHDIHGDATVYHTIGVLFTSNSAAFSQCEYYDGARTSCVGNNFITGANGTQRRILTIWNGVTCGFDPTVTSCVGSFTDSHMYIKSIKVLTCPAEPTGGSCIGNNFNGTFYTP